MLFFKKKKKIKNIIVRIEIQKNHRFDNNADETLL